MALLEPSRLLKRAPDGLQSYTLWNGVFGPSFITIEGSPNNVLWKGVFRQQATETSTAKIPLLTPRLSPLYAPRTATKTIIGLSFFWEGGPPGLTN